MSKCDQYGFSESVCKDSCNNTGDEFSPQTLNTHFTLKTKDSSTQKGCDSPTDSIADDEVGLVKFRATATNVDELDPDYSVETSDKIAPSKDNNELLEELSKANDSISGAEFNGDNETIQHNESRPTIDTPTLELSLLDDADENVGDGSNDRDEIPCSKPSEMQQNDTLNSPGNCEPDKNRDNELDVVGNEKFLTSKYHVKSKTRKKCRSMKNSDFIKAVQTWNMQGSTNITVAEVYMMLGKPSMFKLCYHWLHGTEELDKNNDGRSCDDGTSPLMIPSLSSGLSALLQAAGISKQLRDTDISRVGKEKPTSDCLKSTKAASVQCELLKETDKVKLLVYLELGIWLLETFMYFFAHLCYFTKCRFQMKLLAFPLQLQLVVILTEGA